jgi:two-component system phosphate regulon sensor histidine kinase PhoR
MLERIRKGEFGYLKNSSKGHRDLLMRSINEIYSIANIQQAEINELKKMETYRREFLADVSHELKTPLFAAQGFVHTLLDGAVKDKSVRIKFLKKAAKSLAGLDKLVQDLMIISQMEAGFVKMRYTNFNIFELVEDVFEQFDEKANKKELTLCYAENTSRDAIVYADRERIFQVMINLVSNGIKYTTEKGGKVMVGITPHEGLVMVEVSDDGIGIPQEDHIRIFERFYRVEKSRSKDKGGTGLGLAIVKHILEAHNQKIAVTSTVGKGSVFRFGLEASAK